MEKLRWGVLGISGHYRLRIHQALKGYDGAELCGIASRDEKRAAEAAVALGFKRSYGSYQALLDDESIDAVYIPLPNNLHLEWIRKAADAGKHIICEKPLCMDAVEVEEAFSYCAEKGVSLMEAFMFRFHPQWLRVKQIVDSGEIGRIRSIQSIFSYKNTDPQNIRNRMENGGGALRDIGCYCIAVSNLLLELEPVRISSFIERDSEFGIDSFTSFMIDYGGAHSLSTVSTQLFSNQGVSICGTGGKLHVEIPFNMYSDVPARIRVTTGVGQRIIKTEVVDQYRCEFEAFTDAVKSNDSGFFNTMKGFSIRNQRAIDAVFSAAGEDASGA